MRILLFLLLPSVLACSPLQVDVELDEACISADNIPIFGTKQPRVWVRFWLTEFGTLQEMAANGAEIILTEITIEPTTGPGIDITRGRAQIDSADPTIKLPSLVIECGRGTGLPCMSGGSVVLPTTLQDDVGPYVKTGEIMATLDVEGTLPERTWLANMSVCMAGNFEWDLH